MYEERVKRAIEAIKKGEMIIIMDDEDRENEGDLVMDFLHTAKNQLYGARGTGAHLCIHHK